MGGEAGNKTVVVKVGTSSILRGESGHLALSTLAALVENLCSLRAAGHRVVLVSSGAVGVGCQRMGVKKRPEKIAELQAMAAIGQPHLMRHYDILFASLNQPIAQVLLTADALGSRSGYLNAQTTFRELLALGVIPVVNENDTVAVTELGFGDNDTLSALVAILVDADWLFLATDVDALYTANPNVVPPAGSPPPKAIRVVEDVETVLRDVENAGSTSGTQWGTGGIVTKLRAAWLAGAAGVNTTIVHAQRPDDVSAVLNGHTDVGTTFLPLPRTVRSHKRWIMALPAPGFLRVDTGASKAVRAGSSLFAAGLVVDGIGGQFAQRDAVRIIDEHGVEFARGLVNYGFEHASRLCGHRSSDMEELLGFHGPDELISRENMVLLSTFSPMASIENVEQC